MGHIKNKYFVGQSQPYGSVSQVLNTIKTELESGSYTLPSTDTSDGGNVNIVLVGGGIHQPFVVPDGLTPKLNDEGRRLVITRQEFTDTGVLDTTSMPVITPEAPGAGDLPIQDKVNCVSLGANNPGITVRGLYLRDATIGLQVGFNSHSARIERCVIANNSNVQLYAHELEELRLLNNVMVGGEYGIVAKFVKKIRAYHNTVYIDGDTALSGKAKAGIVLQGERTFGNTSPSTLYCAGNLVYSVGAPAAIFYDTELNGERLVSDYNNFFAVGSHLVELRQDTVQQEGEDEVVLKKYYSIPEWRQAGPLGADLTTPVDSNSVSMDPFFIQKTFLVSTDASLLDLSLLAGSPILERVPSWYFTTDSTYIPSDMSSVELTYDILLNTREKPFTAIGANDAPSFNGYFGQDVFASPLDASPTKDCDIDPLQVLTTQKVDMHYPAIMPGYFWSHERPYYLYAKKGVSQLGFLARTEFTLPGFVTRSEDIAVLVQGEEISSEHWDLTGRKLQVWHRDYGITSYEDEVQVKCKVQGWNEHGFFTKDAYYVFKVKDGKTDFVMPSTYNPQGPVVVTDDRSSLRDPVKLVRREFKVEFDSERNESRFEFFHTDNLVENSTFDQSLGSNEPAYWETNPDFTGQVFLLGSNFSYYGDRAAGIQLGPNPGWLGTTNIAIDESKPVSLSWHARIPTGMGISGATGHYHVRWLDHNGDTTSHDDTAGTFHAAETGYSRFYCTFGHGDQDETDGQYDIYGVPVVKTSERVSIPSGVAYMQLRLSGDTVSALPNNSFMMIDAVQAEYSNYPTYYHPEASFDYMTVEWEDSHDGVFIDKRMNISNVFNENPNGFLCIRDMPATIWGGPSDANVTTLHEYKWAAGRINYLPWARLHGKDKLAQRVYGSEIPTEPADIISPIAAVAEPDIAVMRPDPITVTQNTGDVAGFTMRVTDGYGNPYPLRRYTMQVYEADDKYPGQQGTC
jgi:hypothetical protein